MQTWVSADYHLGESERLTQLGRPFSTQDEMVRVLVAKHNALVDKNDIVYIVGDVCYQKTPEFLDRIALFNGKKTLIRGNHDRNITDQQFKKYFTHVVPEGMGIELEVDGIQCYLTHYPTLGRQDKFNLVGHVHAVFKYQLNMMNIGVDVNHFMPVNLNSIPSHFKAISEFYDQDAWVAYNDINTAYLGKRGKKGTYFPKG